jgi:hypothetical protein
VLLVLALVLAVSMALPSVSRRREQVFQED